MEWLLLCWIITSATENQNKTHLTYFFVGQKINYRPAKISNVEL